MENSNILYLLLYKFIVISSGLISLYFGYKLFEKGIYKKSGELTGKIGDYELTLKNSAPGIFFSVFGCIIISCSIISGFKYEIEKKSKEKEIKYSQTDSIEKKPVLKTHKNVDKSNNSKKDSSLDIERQKVPTILINPLDPNYRYEKEKENEYNENGEANNKKNSKTT